MLFQRVVSIVTKVSILKWVRFVYLDIVWNTERNSNDVRQSVWSSRLAVTGLVIASPLMRFIVFIQSLLFFFSCQLFLGTGSPKPRNLHHQIRTIITN